MYTHVQAHTENSSTRSFKYTYVTNTNYSYFTGKTKTRNVTIIYMLKI